MKQLPIDVSDFKRKSIFSYSPTSIWYIIINLNIRIIKIHILFLLLFLTYLKAKACTEPPTKPFACQIATIEENLQKKTDRITINPDAHQFAQHITTIKQSLELQKISDEAMICILNITSFMNPCHLDYHRTTDAYKIFQNLDLNPMMHYLTENNHHDQVLYKDKPEIVCPLIKKLTIFSRIQQELAIHNPSVIFTDKQKPLKKYIRDKQRDMRYNMLLNFFSAQWISQLSGNPQVGSMPIQYLLSARIQQGLLALLNNTEKQKKKAEPCTHEQPLQKSNQQNNTHEESYVTIDEPETTPVLSDNNQAQNDSDSAIYTTNVEKISDSNNFQKPRKGLEANSRRLLSRYNLVKFYQKYNRPEFKISELTTLKNILDQKIVDDFAILTTSYDHTASLEFLTKVYEKDSTEEASTEKIFTQDQREIYDRYCKQQEQRRKNQVLYGKFSIMIGSSLGLLTVASILYTLIQLYSFVITG